MIPLKCFFYILPLLLQHEIMAAPTRIMAAPAPDRTRDTARDTTSPGPLSVRSLIDSFMRAERRVNHFNGNVLVAGGGKVLYQHSFGYSDFTTGKLLDSNSIFVLASVSKQFTAMGLLLLQKAGKLSLSDTLRKFFPELPYCNITLRQMLCHTSGLPDYIAAMQAGWDHKKIATNADMIRFLATEKPPVLFEPGKQWKYSNTAFVLLASIIEKASGQPFSKYLHDRIFKPLGMTRTSVHNRRLSGKVPPDYAYGFSYDKSRYILPDSIPRLELVYYLDGIQGDGCVNSTTGDLLKWDRALLGHVLLDKASQLPMLSPQATEDTLSHIYYGYGVEVGRNVFGNYLAHGGIWPGYRTNLARYTDKDITLIVLSNNESDANGIAYALASIAHTGQIVMPYKHKEIAIDSSILHNYVGQYLSPAPVAIISNNGKLYRHRSGAPDVELKPESVSKFFYADDTDRQIEFDIDGQGKVINAWLISTGVKSPLRRS